MQKLSALEQLKDNILNYMWETTDIDAAIHKVLKMIGTHFFADRVYIAECGADGNVLVNPFVWHAASNVGIKDKTAMDCNLHINNFTSITDNDMVHTKKNVSSASVSLTTGQLEVCSALQVSIVQQNRLAAYLGVMDYNKDRVEWQTDPNIHAALLSISRILGVFLLKARHEQRSENYQESLRNLLQNSEKREDLAYELLDSISAGIILVRMYPNGSARPLYGNLGMYRILQIPRTAESERVPDRDSAQLESEYFDDFFANIPEPDIERVRMEYKNGYNKNYFKVKKYRLLCGDGRYVWVSADMRLCEATPNYRTYYATYTDMTEEMVLQSGLMTSLEKEKNISSALESANMAKSEFLARMSHEIRTPLNAIIGLTTIASAHINEYARMEDCLSKISISSKHLLSIVNDVLDMSKIEDRKMSIYKKPFELPQFLLNISALCGPGFEENKQNFDISINAVEEEILLGDMLRLQQIISNILSNAQKFTLPGGHISLHVEQERKDHDQVVMRFIISDTGIGMGEEFIDRIFLPFEQEDQSITRHYDGTGLGMPITKSLVELMEGSIKVESKQGVGSRFILEIPFGIPEKKVLEKQEQADGNNEQESLPSKNGNENICLTGNILLCEDNELNTEIAVFLLEEAGASVQCAENGKIALEKFSLSKPYTYDIILMDIMMPEMDGLEAARSIRALERVDAKVIPIIAMTANAYDEDKKKSMDVGMNAHLTKPINPEELYRMIQKYLSMKN